MKAKMSHIQMGINNWYAESAATLGWKAVLMTPLVNLGVSQMINNNSGAISLLTDKDGYIDIDTLYKDYSEIISKAGSIELFGIKFNSQDLNNLYEKIKVQVPPT